MLKSEWPNTQNVISMDNFPNKAKGILSATGYDKPIREKNQKRRQSWEESNRKKRKTCGIWPLVIGTTAEKNKQDTLWRKAGRRYKKSLKVFL